MHHDFPSQLGQALLMAFGMFWDVGWSLVLGFTISAAIQAFVSTGQMRRAFGRDGFREIALATIAGAVSSSCSYASAAITRSLFKKGGGADPFACLSVRLNKSRHRARHHPLPADGLAVHRRRMDRRHGADCDHESSRAPYLSGAAGGGGAPSPRGRWGSRARKRGDRGRELLA